MKVFSLGMSDEGREMIVAAVADSATIARLDDDVFWLTGSYYLQEWHLRWFRAHLPPSGVEITNITERCEST